MKVLAIIQARMGSSRLPGKMLIPIIDGKGALELMIERVSQAKKIDQLIVATTTDRSDDKLVELCKNLGITCFRGSVDDVLDRFYQAALSMVDKPEFLVRLTGDCPLHDASVIDKVIDAAIDSNADYVSNVDPPTYPDGLDTEVFHLSVLEKAWNKAELKSEREHVTVYIRNHPELFRLKNVKNPNDFSEYRWTLDEKADFEFISAIFGKLYRNKSEFGMNDILGCLKMMPELLEINEGISRNEGLDKSLKEEQN